ncbi:MAG: hypothetical protein GY787_00310 [Alteromonadales bacterium]|nr:hypothetical protein [Alteromonadales bacterium]
MNLFTMQVSENYANLTKPYYIALGCKNDLILSKLTHQVGAPVDLFGAW